MGNYLSSPRRSSSSGEDSTPWAVQLGSYLNERKPGPWSLIANERPQDPLALRLGTFLNETKPLGNFGLSSSGASNDAAKSATGSEPLVLRLGKYLNGDKGEGNASADSSPPEVTVSETAPVDTKPPPPSDIAEAKPSPPVAAASAPAVEVTPDEATPNEPQPAGGPVEDAAHAAGGCAGSSA